MYIKLVVCCRTLREDYTRLFEFVSEKNLRVKNKGKVPQQKVKYDDDMSSESDHDAYLERMKAEGEERDSEDGVYLSPSHSLFLSLSLTIFSFSLSLFLSPLCFITSPTPCFLVSYLFMLSIYPSNAEDSDFVAKESGTDDELE